MSDEHCGDCLYQADTNPEEVFCMVDKDWYEKGYKCDKHRKFSNMPINLRLDMANEVKIRKEAKETEQRDREFAEKEAEKDRKHAEELARKNLWITIIIAVGTIILGALITKLFSLW